MNNAKKQLKKAMKNTTNFMLNLEVNSSDRVPEWYDQMALSAEHNDLNESIYKSLLNKLSKKLKSEYGNSAARFILS